jgi:hypothetical protein
MIPPAAPADQLLEDVLASVPDDLEFLTVDELLASSAALAERHPDLVQRREVGRSTEGRPIETLTIGHGPRRALLVGVPHPNEPIGTLTLEVLARLLIARPDAFGASAWQFTMVKVADPDGLALNAGWLKGAFDLRRYALGYYRSPAREQVEWGFPIDHQALHFHDPPAETRALMQVIDEQQPELLYSLHNASFCGVYFYASRALPALFECLTRLVESRGLPLHRGEPEVPYITAYADGFYPLFGAREAYDFYARTAGDQPERLIAAGTSSTDYLRRVVPSAFALISELPYFTDTTLSDVSLSLRSRRDAVTEGLERTERTFHEVARHFAALAPLRARMSSDRLFRAVLDWVARTPHRLTAARSSVASSDYSAPATRAQAFDAMVAKPVHALFVLGETRRLAEDVGESGRAAEILAVLDERIGDILAAGTIRVLPLKALVEIQLGALLLALDALALPPR